MGGRGCHTQEQGGVRLHRISYTVYAVQAGPSCFSVLLHLKVNLSLAYCFAEMRVMSSVPQQKFKYVIGERLKLWADKSL